MINKSMTIRSKQKKKETMIKGEKKGREGEGTIEKHKRGGERP